MAFEKKVFDLEPDAKAKSLGQHKNYSKFYCADTLEVWADLSKKT